VTTPDPRAALLALADQWDNFDGNPYDPNSDPGWDERRKCAEQLRAALATPAAPEAAVERCAECGQWQGYGSHDIDSARLYSLPYHPFQPAPEAAVERCEGDPNCYCRTYPDRTKCSCRCHIPPAPTEAAEALDDDGPHGLNCFVTEEVGCVCGYDQRVERDEFIRGVSYWDGFAAGEEAAARAPLTEDACRWPGCLFAGMPHYAHAEGYDQPVYAILAALGSDQ